MKSRQGGLGALSGFTHTSSPQNKRLVTGVVWAGQHHLPANERAWKQAQYPVGDPSAAAALAVVNPKYHQGKKCVVEGIRLI